MKYLEINKKINIRKSLSKKTTTTKQQQQKRTENYMLTSEIRGTLLDLGCQFQWSLGV